VFTQAAPLGPVWQGPLAGSKNFWIVPSDHAAGDNEFQKFGESEFVIRKGAPIEVVGAQSTAEYCKPG
jgi:hypothetical protein